MDFLEQFLRVDSGEITGGFSRGIVGKKTSGEFSEDFQEVFQEESLRDYFQMRGF